MRKTLFTITFPHLFSPISAFSSESKSNIIKLRFNVYETHQINPLNYLNFNLTFVRQRRCPLQISKRRDV